MNKVFDLIEKERVRQENEVCLIASENYTSKNDKESHGLGLYEVRKILNRNNNLNLFTTKNSEYFRQQLEIYY